MFTALLPGTFSFDEALTLIWFVSGLASALIFTAMVAFAPTSRMPKLQTLIAALLQVPWLGVMLRTVPLETISVNVTLVALSGPLFLTVYL